MISIHASYIVIYPLCLLVLFLTDQLPFQNQLYSMQTARRHSMNSSELYSPYNRQQCQYMPMDSDIKSRKQSGVCEQADPTQHISESRSGIVKHIRI